MKAHGWSSAEVISEACHLPRAGLIFSRLPIQWRVHAAPPLRAARRGLREAAGHQRWSLKTVRYLVWTRQIERCQPYSGKCRPGTHCPWSAWSCKLIGDAPFSKILRLFRCRGSSGSVCRTPCPGSEHSQPRPPAMALTFRSDPLAHVRYDNRYDVSLGMAYDHMKAGQTCCKVSNLGGLDGTARFG